MGLLSKNRMLVKGTKSMIVGGFLAAPEDNEVVDAAVAIAIQSAGNLSDLKSYIINLFKSSPEPIK